MFRIFKKSPEERYFLYSPIGIIKVIGNLKEEILESVLQIPSEYLDSGKVKRRDIKRPRKIYVNILGRMVKVGDYIEINPSRNLYFSITPNVVDEVMQNATKAKMERHGNLYYLESAISPEVVPPFESFTFLPEDAVDALENYNWLPVLPRTYELLARRDEAISNSGWIRREIRPEQ